MRDILLEYVYPVIANIIEEYADTEYTEPINLAKPCNLRKVLHCLENIKYEIINGALCPYWYIYAPYAIDVKAGENKGYTTFFIIHEELTNEQLEKLCRTDSAYEAYINMMSINHTKI